MPTLLKWLITAGTAVGVLLMLGVAAKVAVGGAKSRAGEDTAPAASEQVEKLLAECRSWSAADPGAQPDWKRAREACERARYLDPINGQVIAQLQKISIEEECQKHFDAGKQLLDRLREEEALEELGKIDKACTYYRAAMLKARQAILAAKKRAREDCTNCPRMPMLRQESSAADPLAEVKQAIQARYAEPLMQTAMELYWGGKASEATLMLVRVRENRGLAALHAEADDLRADISAVQNLYKSGSTLLQASDFDKAAAAFREALTIDQRLMKSLATANPSFYRSVMQKEMAKAAYQGGKTRADREDPRGGCRIWKLGFGFYRGNPELNRAVGFCSNEGARRLAAASSCEELEKVLDYAVEGDGLGKMVAEKRAELHCGA